MREKYYYDLPILIPIWVIKETELKGTDLFVFCIIDRYSNEYCSGFSNIGYLADVTNTCEKTINRVLKRLVEKDYILRNDTISNCKKITFYKVNYKKFDEVENEL